MQLGWLFEQTHALECTRTWARALTLRKTITPSDDNELEKQRPEKTGSHGVRLAWSSLVHSKMTLNP